MAAPEDRKVCSAIFRVGIVGHTAENSLSKAETWHTRAAERMHGSNAGAKT